MFHHMNQQARKYSPTRLAEGARSAAQGGVALQAVVCSPPGGGEGAKRRRYCPLEDREEDPTLPSTKTRPPRNNNQVRAVRRHPASSQHHNPGLGELEEAWSQRAALGGRDGSPGAPRAWGSQDGPPGTPWSQRAALGGRDGSPGAGTPPLPRRSPPAEVPISPPVLRVQEDAGPPEPPGPPRSRKRGGYRAPHVRTIFSPSQRDPRVRQERGEGHHFVPGGDGTWCDVCCGYVLHHSVTCTGCKYTCHTACEDRVTLDCTAGAAQDHLDHLTQTPGVEEREQRTQLSREEIKQKVDLYNSLTSDPLKMTLSSSGVYTGFIKVQLELRRPVTVRGARTAGPCGPAVDEAFYLPRGATNTLHISSTNTVKQVIVALLNKFTVADNPAKYALYKRCTREEQVYMCRLAEGEQPLFLRLLAGPNTDVLNFVLREQHQGEMMWEAFSVPELSNFLRILEKEEVEQVDAIARRYGNYRQRLQEALSHATKSTTTAP